MISIAIFATLLHIGLFLLICHVSPDFTQLRRDFCDLHVRICCLDLTSFFVREKEERRHGPLWSTLGVNPEFKSNRRFILMTPLFGNRNVKRTIVCIHFPTISQLIFFCQFHIGSLSSSVIAAHFSAIIRTISVTYELHNSVFTTFVPCSTLALMRGRISLLNIMYGVKAFLGASGAFLCFLLLRIFISRPIYHMLEHSITVKVKYQQQQVSRKDIKYESRVK